MKKTDLYIKTLLPGALLFVTTFSCLAEKLNVTISYDLDGSVQCMDLKADKKGIAFNQCNDSATQKWQIETINGVYNTIKNSTLPKDMCLFSTSNETVVDMRNCDSGTFKSQSYWELVTDDNKHYSLRNKLQTDYRKSGWLSVSDNQLVLNAENSATAQWTLQDTLIKQVAITNSLAGQNKCMDLAPDNKNVVFNTCNDAGSQQWRLDDSAGYLKIINIALGDNTCLFTNTKGTSLDMRRCGSGTYHSQNLWTVNPKTTGKFSLVSKVQRDFGRNGEISINSDNKLTLNDAQAAAGNWGLGDYKAPGRNYKGEVSVLLLNTHFTGVAERPTAQIKKALFGGNGEYSSLKEYLELASRGTFTIKEGKTLDNLDIGSPGSACDSNGYKKKALELAKARGVNPDDYDVIFVEHTSNKTCSYAANATFPTSLNKPGKYITVNDTGHKYWMWSHEFGHTLGFRHSNILVNCPATSTGVKLDSTCKIGGIDGGGNDLTDTMGGGGGNMYPVNYMYETGWLSERDFPVVGNGTYKIDPLLDNKGGKQGLRIARNNASFPYLTLEFRQQGRFDKNWSPDSPFVNGVIVRQINPQSLSSYNVNINTTPGSKDRAATPLMPGKTLYDTYSGKVIKVDSVDQDGAVVTISDYQPDGE